jgi:hypothetical protein
LVDPVRVHQREDPVQVPLAVDGLVGADLVLVVGDLATGLLGARAVDSSRLLVQLESPRGDLVRDVIIVDRMDISGGIVLSVHRAVVLV